MVKGSQRMRFVLFFVVFVALFTGLFLRATIQSDFQKYVEGERSALVLLVLSDMEGSYEKSGKWDREAVAEIMVQALNLGLRVRLHDRRDDAVLDTEQALAVLPSVRTSRVRADAGFSKDDTVTDYRSYPLVIGGEKAGRLDVRFLGNTRSDSFARRSGTVVLIGVFLLAALIGAAVTLVSRKQAWPARKTIPTAADGGSELNRATPAEDRNETVAVPEPEKRSVSTDAPAASMADGPEEEMDPMPDDPLDADDADMLPLAVDPDRISKIVKGLDGLAKAQALRGAMRKQRIELLPYFNNVVEKTRQSLPGADVTFTVECGSDQSMSVDPECLMGIVSSLLDNAAKAVKHDGTVTVSASEKGERIEITISDTGCGIRRKALPHIFERFYRGSGEGIGLGLTIVKELVDACEGTMAVHSTRGKGSVFTVSIPRS